MAEMSQPPRKKEKMDVGTVQTDMPIPKPLSGREAENLQELVDGLFGDTEVVDEGFCAEPPTCPRCEVPMDYGEVVKEDGETFCYWRCPKEEDGVKCFVTHSNDDDFESFILTVKMQLASCYQPSGDRVKGHKKRIIPFSNMECYCCESLVLLKSRSEKNPNRLFLKCRKNQCDFF